MVLGDIKGSKHDTSKKAAIIEFIKNKILFRKDKFFTQLNLNSLLICFSFL